MVITLATLTAPASPQSPTHDPGTTVAVGEPMVGVAAMRVGVAVALGTAVGETPPTGANVTPRKAWFVGAL